jgi:hypothetical protein
MFHFLEYPFSRGFTHIKSADPYDTPDFDAGFVSQVTYCHESLLTTSDER